MIFQNPIRLVLPPCLVGLVVELPLLVVPAALRRLVGLRAKQLQVGVAPTPTLKREGSQLTPGLVAAPSVAAPLP